MPDCLTYNPSAIISALHSDSRKGNSGEECNDFYKGVSQSYHKQMRNPGGNGPLSNVLTKLSHCHCPYPKVLGQLQFNDSIVQSRSECQAVTEAISFKGVMRQKLGGIESSGLALRKRRVHLKFCSFLYFLSTALLSHSTDQSFLLLHTVVISGILFLNHKNWLGLRYFSTWWR